MPVGLPLVVLSQTSKGLKCVDGEAVFSTTSPAFSLGRIAERVGRGGGCCVTNICLFDSCLCFPLEMSWLSLSRIVAFCSLECVKLKRMEWKFFE